MSLPMLTLHVRQQDCNSELRVTLNLFWLTGSLHVCVLVVRGQQCYLHKRVTAFVCADGFLHML